MKERQSVCYTLARGVAFLLFHTLTPVVFHHRERIARAEAPFIAIANHRSLLDPMALGYMCPCQIRFLAKKELLNNRLLAAMFRNLRVIPVHRHNMDMTAMRACLKALRDGHVLGVFPEGTRHRSGLMEDIETGVGMIALKANAPLIPVYFSGRIRPFRVTHAYVGEPIPFDDILAEGPVGRPSCDKLLARIREWYAEARATHGAR